MTIGKKYCRLLGSLSNSANFVLLYHCNIPSWTELYCMILYMYLHNATFHNVFINHNKSN